MKLLLAAILLVQSATLGVMLFKHDTAPHYAWQDAPIVHGPWENYQK